MTIKPAISVIMPVYNAGKYVGEAIQSILDQSFTDFEFIIIDDGSTDDSLEIIHSFKDHRIKILNNSSNIGNYPSRNKGHRAATGKYICVMDADDFALKQRLDRQYIYMENNSEIGLAGSGFRYYDKEEDIFRENNYERIRVLLFRNICFIHPTLIIRSDFIKRINLEYNEKYYYAADYDFIMRASRNFPVTNIPEVLLYYRIHGDQISTKNKTKQREYVKEIVIEQLRSIGLNPDQAQIKLHFELIHGIPIEYFRKQKLIEWIDDIIKVNQNKKLFPEDELELFFNSLLSLQPFCNIKENIILRTEFPFSNMKYNLTDVTFVIHLKIDSRQRAENADTIIKFLTCHFNTNVSILEVDKEQRYYHNIHHGKVCYRFIRDSEEIFHRTKLVNQLISTTSTPYVAIWDSDVIAPQRQVIEAVEKLRTGKAVMSLPYDGRFYGCDESFSELFKTKLNIGLLEKLLPVMSLINGYHSVGGVFIVNKEKYLEAGGENENICGWGYEDDERVKRMEVMNLPIHYSAGSLFHLWHPMDKNSMFSDNEIKRRNLSELIKTCKSFSTT